MAGDIPKQLQQQQQRSLITVTSKITKKVWNSVRMTQMWHKDSEVSKKEK